MPLAASNIGLGVVFTGKVDETFRQAVAKLRASMYELVNIQKQVSSNSSAKGMTLYDELSNIVAVQGKLESMSPKLGAAFGQLKHHIDSGAVSAKELGNELVKNEKLIQRHALSMTANGKDGKAWANTIDRVALAQRTLASTYQTTGEKLGVLSPLEKARTAQVQKTTAATQQLNRGMTGLHSEVAMATGVFERLSRAFKVIAAYGVAGTIVGALTMGFANAANTVKEFDQALKNLQAITSATDDEVGAMGRTLRTLAADPMIKYGPTELAQGMTLLGQAGLSAAESMNTIKPSALLASGTLSEMATTTDLLSTALMAFKINSVESGRVADVMANALNKSKLDVDKLRVAFNYVAASASEAGLSLEQTAASMMVLSNNGLRASTIGTGLRQVLSKLISPNAKLQEAYEEHSIALDKINPTVVGWGEALKNLSTVLYNHQKGVVDMSKAYQLFELRGAQAAAILVKSYMSGDYQKMLEYTYEIGAAQEMAAIQAEGLGQKLTNLGNRVKVLAIAFGDAGIVGVLKSMVDVLSAAVSAFEYFATSTIGGVILQVGILSGSLYGILRVINLVKNALILYGTTFVAVEAGFMATATAGAKFAVSMAAAKAGLVAIAGALTGPLGIIAGLTLLGVIIYRAVTANERFIKQIGEQIVQNTQVVNSLEAYRAALSHLNEQMNDGKNVQLEYSAMVKRLISDHPELRRQIDQTKLAYREYRQELDETLKKTIALQARQAGTDFGAKLKAQQAEIAKENNYYEELFKRKDALSKSDEFMANSRRRLSVLNKDYAQTTEDLVKYLVDLYRVGGMTLPQISALSRMMFGASESGNRMAETIHERVVAELLRANPAIAGTAEEIEKMSDRMRGFANSLKPADRLDFLKSFKQLQNEIASDKDVNRKSKLLSQEDMKIAIAAKEEQFLREYQLKVAQNSKIASAQVLHENLMARLETDGREKIVKQYEAVDAQITAMRERNVANAKGDADKITKIDERASEERLANEKHRDAEIEKLEKKMAGRNAKLTAQISSADADSLRMIASLETDKESKIIAKYEATDAAITAFRDSEYAKAKGNAERIATIDRQVGEQREANERKLDAELEKLYAKRTQARLKDAAHVSAAEAQSQRLLLSLETDRKARIEREYTENEASIQAFKDREYSLAKGNAARLRAVDEEVSAARIANEKKKDYDLDQLEMQLAEDRINLAKTEALIRLEISKREAGESAEYKKELLQKEAELTVNTLQQISDLREVFYKKALARFGENDERTIAAHQAYKNSLLAIEVAISGGTKKEEDDRLRYDLKMTQKHLEEKYNLGLMSTQQYLDALKRLYENRAIDEEVYNERVIAANGNIFTQLGYGLTRARAEMQTWGEMWIQVGKEISSVVADDLTAAWFEYAEGSKTAKEAFTDFAKSTLKWISQLIIKTAILRAISSIAGSFSTSIPANNFDLMHGGGIVGKTQGALRSLPESTLAYAPRLHKGLLPDEYPAILKKDEGVFTPEQMKALSSSGGGQGEVHVHFDKVIIQANDALSFTQMIQRNPKAISAVFADAVTRGNMTVINKIREAIA